MRTGDRPPEARERGMRLEPWLEEVRRCGLLDGVTAYDGPGEAHFRRAAAWCARSFHDPVLARAAYLHGLTPGRAGEAPGAGPDEERLLDGWRALLGRMAGDASPAGIAPRVLLTGVDDPRVPALFTVLETVHADPSGTLEAWTRRFFAAPSPLPGLEPPVAGCHAFLDRPLDALARAGDTMAPLARACGFWIERDVLRNAALYRLDPARFAELVGFAVEASAPGGPCALHVATVRAGLAEHVEFLDGRDDAVRWEWSHVASFAERLRPGDRARWDPADCGFVTVVCRDPIACYRVLRELHARFGYLRKGLLDLIGSSSPRGYQALHTVLVLDGAGGHAALVPVRVVPAESDRARFESASGRRLAHIRERLQGTRRIVAYTPGRRALSLPAGATVLEFAATLHSDLALRSESAVLNGTKKVDVLHPLEDGDVVRLIVGREPRALPPGWRQLVPPAAAVRIGRALRAGPRRLALAALRERISAGRDWVMTQVRRRGLEAVLVAEVLDEAVAAASARLPPPPAVGRTCSAAGRCYARLGRLAAAGDADVPAGEADWRDRLLARVTALLLTRYAGAVLDLPADVAGRAVRVGWCRACRPDLSGPVAGSLWRDGSLWLHRPAHAGPDAVPAAWRRAVRHVTLALRNHPGLAADVLRVFGDLGLDVVDLVARRTADDAAEMVVGVAGLGGDLEARLLDRLRALPEVATVTGPAEPGSAPN